MSAGGDELPAARPLSTSGNNELINPLHGDATAKATRTRAASCGVQGLSPSLSPPVGRAHSARSNSRSERSERVKRLTSLKNVSTAAVAAQQDIGRSTPTCTHHPPSTTQVTIEMADTAQSSSFAASVSSNGYKRSTSGGRPGSDSETKTDDTAFEGSTRQKATPDISLPRRHTVDIPRGTAVISFPRFLRAAENYHGVTA